MKKIELLNLLEDRKIQAFESNTELDPDTDIILTESNVEEFIRFCKTVNSNIAFYNMKFWEEEDYVVDEDEFQSIIEEKIMEALPCYYAQDDEILSLEDFSENIELQMKEVSKHNEKAREQLEKVNGEAAFVDVFVPYQGIQVGIQMYNPVMDGILFAPQIIENLDEFVELVVENKKEERQLDDISLYRKRAKELEEQKRSLEDKHRDAMIEIGDYMEEDDEILRCKNKSLRRGYSRKIAKQFSDKYEIKITINEVEYITEEIYHKRISEM